MIDFKYTGIEYGYISFDAIQEDKKVDFIFNDLDEDPLPQFINFMNHVKTDKNYQQIVINILEEKILRLSIKDRDDNKVEFEIYEFKHGITLKEIVNREYVVKIFEKISSDLLNDEAFPYMYPCYCRLDDDSFEIASDEIDKILEKNFELNYEGQYEKEKELLVKYMREGRIKMETGGENVFKKYKIMLTEYKIPEGWL